MLEPGSFQREGLRAENLLLVLASSCLVQSSEPECWGGQADRHPRPAEGPPQPRGAKLINESDPNNFLPKAHKLFHVSSPRSEARVSKFFLIP